MTHTKWTIRLGIVGAVVSVAVLASSATTTSAAQGAAVTGVHANEEFCKTGSSLVQLFFAYQKSDPLRKPDATKRAKFFADWKALNATLVKTAPASLASDMALEHTDMTATIDAQMSGDPKRIAAAEAASSSPQAEARSKRVNDYCGVKN